ncbi:Hypothetical predicted protein [Olea europaea subsp. europaea]|uniref:Uncharacterized protein n=1 Tax=Olea europaea subsp. europaea TaxID=158383 RepID=A0A8S0TVP4_OLEEU|nr:Hypothetical predicted protein [Olea europaea subsp. europaea]
MRTIPKSSHLDVRRHDVNYLKVSQTIARYYEQLLALLSPAIVIKWCWQAAMVANGSCFVVEIVALRDEIGVLRRDLGKFHTEVAALRGDVAGFRGSVRGSVRETGVHRDWWATAAGIDEFFLFSAGAREGGVEVGSDMPEEAGVEVPDEVEMIGGGGRDRDAGGRDRSAGGGDRGGSGGNTRGSSRVG